MVLKPAPVVVFSDRDGTINFDENYYLGSDSNWKQQLSFLPGVVEGIQFLKTLPYCKFFVVTNQSGVARGDLPELTEERLFEVNEHIKSMLANQNAIVDGFFSCPYVDSAYAKKYASRGVNPEYIFDNHPDMKPNVGLLEKACRSADLSLGSVKYKFMIGDRLSDVEAGLAASCISILVASHKTRELGDLVKLEDLKESLSEEDRKRIIVAPDFYVASRKIYDVVMQQHM